MCFEDAPRDVEAEAESPPVAAADLPELPEDGLQARGGNSPSGIRDGDAHLAPGAPRADGDAGPSRRELERVAEQIGEHLEDPLAIEAGLERGPAGVRSDLDPVRRGCGLEHLDRFADEGEQVAHCGRHQELPGLDAGDVHQVPDQAVHPRRQALDGLGAREDRRLAITGGLAVALEQFGSHGDASQKRPQVVADHRQEDVPGVERLVGKPALGQEVLVGLLALEAEQVRQRALADLAFVADVLVRGGALVCDHAVRSGTLLDHRRVRRVRFAVGDVARSFQDPVGGQPRPLHDRVRGALHRRVLPFQLAVGLAPFGPQALVRPLTSSVGLTHACLPRRLPCRRCLESLPEVRRSPRAWALCRRRTATIPALRMAKRRRSRPGPLRGARAPCGRGRSGRPSPASSDRG